MINKGQIQADKSYRYTCFRCNGTGALNGALCTDCYGCDTLKIVEAMKAGARGERYYALLKAFLSVRGKAIADECVRIGDEKGGFTPIDIGYLVIVYGLNFKATCEWLEETLSIRPGTYQTFKRTGIKVTDILDRARQEYSLNKVQEANNGR